MTMIVYFMGKDAFYEMRLDGRFIRLDERPDEKDVHLIIVDDPALIMKAAEGPRAEIPRPKNPERANTYWPSREYGGPGSQHISSPRHRGKK